MDRESIDELEKRACLPRLKKGCTVKATEEWYERAKEAVEEVERLRKEVRLLRAHDASAGGSGSDLQAAIDLALLKQQQTNLAIQTACSRGGGSGGGGYDTTETSRLRDKIASLREKVSALRAENQALQQKLNDAEADDNDDDDSVLAEIAKTLKEGGGGGSESMRAQLDDCRQKLAESEAAHDDHLEEIAQQKVLIDGLGERLKKAIESGGGGSSDSQYKKRAEEAEAKLAQRDAELKQLKTFLDQCQEGLEASSKKLEKTPPLFVTGSSPDSDRIMSALASDDTNAERQRLGLSNDLTAQQRADLQRHMTESLPKIFEQAFRANLSQIFPSPQPRILPPIKGAQIYANLVESIKNGIVESRFPSSISAASNELSAIIATSVRTVIDTEESIPSDMRSLYIDLFRSTKTESGGTCKLISGQTTIFGGRLRLVNQIISKAYGKAMCTDVASNPQNSEFYKAALQYREGFNTPAVTAPLATNFADNMKAIIQSYVTEVLSYYASQQAGADVVIQEFITAINENIEANTPASIEVSTTFNFIKKVILDAFDAIQPRQITPVGIEAAISPVQDDIISDGVARAFGDFSTTNAKRLFSGAYTSALFEYRRKGGEIRNRR